MAALFVVLALVATGLTGLVPQQEPRPPQVVTVGANQAVVCVPGPQEGRLAAATRRGRVDLGKVGTAPTSHAAPVVVDTGTDPWVVRSEEGGSQAAASLVTTQGAHTSWQQCSKAATGGLVPLADPSHSDLVVVNPDTRAASLDVTLLGPKGEVVAAGTRDIPVAPGTAVKLPVSAWVSGSGPVTAVLEASQGRVVAAASTSAPQGDDVTTMTPAATRSVLAGVPGGSGDTTLVLANPGTRRSTVQVTALASRGRFTPEGAGEITVEPRSTITVDLTKGLAGEVASLLVTSNRPVAAQARVVRGDDTATVMAGPSATDLLQGLPVPGTLVVSNPGNGVVHLTGSVRTGGRTTSLAADLAAGATWTSSVAGDSQVSLTADHPVAAAVVAAKGGAVVPLQAGAGAPRNHPVAIDPMLG